MINYLTVEQVMQIHRDMIICHGGLSGVKDANLLESCIEMPKSYFFGKDAYPTIYDKAAILLFCIVRNHPFNDANKRTAFLSTILFLKANDVSICFKDEDLENLILEVAKGKHDKEFIAKFLHEGQS